MNRKQRLISIRERQQAGLEAVLFASQSLLDEADSFSMERLEALVLMRSNCINEMEALEKEGQLIARESDMPLETGKVSPAIKVALKGLSKVDGHLQDMMRRQQVAIINSMASMRNRTNFYNPTEHPQMARQLLDVVR